MNMNLNPLQAGGTVVLMLLTMNLPPASAYEGYCWDSSYQWQKQEENSIDLGHGTYVHYYTSPTTGRVLVDFSLQSRSGAPESYGAHFHLEWKKTTNPDIDDYITAETQVFNRVTGGCYISDSVFTDGSLIRATLQGGATMMSGSSSSHCTVEAWAEAAVSTELVVNVYDSSVSSEVRAGGSVACTDGSTWTVTHELITRSPQVFVMSLGVIDPEPDPDPPSDRGTFRYQASVTTGIYGGAEIDPNVACLLRRDVVPPSAHVDLAREYPNLIIRDVQDPVSSMGFPPGDVGALICLYNGDRLTHADWGLLDGWAGLDVMTDNFDVYVNPSTFAEDLSYWYIGGKGTAEYHAFY